MPDVTKFNTLTFDCYGTLIDWERGIHAELRPWVDRHGRRDLDDNALLGDLRHDRGGVRGRDARQALP